MARITVEDCLTRENNRFALVQLASKRTKQLLTGAHVQVNDRRNKAVVTALREIAGGKVRFMTTEEAAAFEEERQRELEAQRALAEANREKAAAAAAAFAGLFTNGSEAKPLDPLMIAGTPGDDDEGDDE
jgi:DNA-directed RNA polymerase subunit omega